MSRILTSLLLYKFGYFSGKYVSMEKLIEESGLNYYKALRNSNDDWHTNDNDELPFLKYMIDIILKSEESAVFSFKTYDELKEEYKDIKK